MSFDPEHLGRSGRGLADTGRLLEWAALAMHPSSTTLGRVAAAAAVARLGARLGPAGGRLLRRHPVASLLVAAGLLAALYLARAPREPPPPRLRLG